MIELLPVPFRDDPSQFGLSLLRLIRIHKAQAIADPMDMDINRDLIFPECIDKDDIRGFPSNPWQPDQVIP